MGLEYVAWLGPPAALYSERSPSGAPAPRRRQGPLWVNEPRQDASRVHNQFIMLHRCMAAPVPVPMSASAATAVSRLHFISPKIFNYEIRDCLERDTKEVANELRGHTPHTKATIAA